MKNIDLLLNKYFEGETSLEEERSLKVYFSSGNIAEEHTQYAPLFGFFGAAQKVEMEKEIGESTFIDVLLERYFEGETDIDDERTLKTYFNGEDIAEEHLQFQPLFNFFTQSQAEKLERDLDLSSNKEAKVIRFRSIRRQVMGIAAGLIIIFGSIFIMNNYMDRTEMQMVESTVEDPEEALEATMEALAYLGVQFNKGTENFDKIKTLEKTQILRNN